MPVCAYLRNQNPEMGCRQRHSEVSVMKAGSAWCTGCCGLVTKDSTKRLECLLQVITTIKLLLGLA